MRRFTADYLEETRRGMWRSRGALAELDLPGRERILDVGCGTGALTRVLRRESDARVVGLDADRSLLTHADPDDRVAGDGVRLPFADGAVDLVVCQALLVNLPDPGSAIDGFARVSSELVATIEPDNGAVTIESTVEDEPRLARRARETYIEGVGTDATLGAVGEEFRRAGLSDISTRRHLHRLTVEPPYSEADLERAARKAGGERLGTQRATLLDGGLTPERYDDLRDEWRAMGRTVVNQMREGEYEREETVPFYVTVGRV